MHEHDGEEHHDLHIPGSEAKPGMGYEPQDILTRRTLIWFCIVHFGGLIATLILTVFLWRIFEKGIGPNPAELPPGAPERQLPAEPRLQPNPHGDINALHIKDEQLGTYWLDTKGKARMPLERAIELTAEDDLPHRQGVGNAR
jgi:hypothetical protein